MCISGNVFHQQERFKLYLMLERAKSEERAFDHLPVFLWSGASLQKPEQMVLIYLMGVFLSC